jgi:hypothetical protein
LQLLTLKGAARMAKWQKLTLMLRLTFLRQGLDCRDAALAMHLRSLRSSSAAVGRAARAIRRTASHHALRPCYPFPLPSIPYPCSGWLFEAYPLSPDGGE